MDTQIRLMDCCPAGNNVGGSVWREGCHLAIHNDHSKHSARLKSKVTCQMLTYQILPFLHAVIVYKNECGYMEEEMATWNQDKGQMKKWQINCQSKFKPKRIKACEIVKLIQ